VDGLRRSFDGFVQKQKQHNNTVALNLDQIMSYMTLVAAKVGVTSLEDKGSNFKPVELSDGYAPKKPPNPRMHAQANKSVHILESPNVVQAQYYFPPPVQTIQYYDLEQLEGFQKNPGDKALRNDGNPFSWRPQYTEVDYGWEDCPLDT
jgi:hypothetical protein